MAHLLYIKTFVRSVCSKTLKLYKKRFWQRTKICPDIITKTQNDIIETLLVTLFSTLKKFLFAYVTLEVTIQKNFSISPKFSKETSLVESHHS